MAAEAQVPIPTFLAIELAAHVAGASPDDLVFAGIRTDEPLRVSTFRQSLGVAARRIGLPDLHPHELRHTAASLAIASGADVKVVQQMLGHASAAMTLDTYGHLFVAPVLPEPDLGENDEGAPSCVSAGQDPLHDLYPRPDSNRRYRRERATTESPDDVGNH